jgi:amino acid adenylation domain-containing protein
MARCIEQLRAQPTGWVQEPPIEVMSRERALPVSFSQLRMWFVQQFDPEATAYNMSFALRLTGQLDVAALAAALEALVRRHEAFRTTFSVDNGEPVQRIGAPAPVPIAQVDLRHLHEAERKSEAARLFTAESVRPFDLERGPLFRFVLVRLGEAEHALLWLVHHVVFDHWSAGVVSREFVMLYRALARGESLTLPLLPIQYADFAAWERRHLGGDALRGQLAYWRGKLADLPVLALPTDQPRPARQTFRGSYVVAPIPPATLTALKRMSACHSATVFMSLLACFKLLLVRYTGQDDVAVGCPIANRTRVLTENLVGTLVNILVMRTSAEGDPSFSAFLERVRATALEAYAHQDVPFERLVEELGGARDASHAPMSRFAFEDLDVDVFDFDPGSVQFDLSMTVDTEVFGRVFLAYSTDLFETATAQRLLAHYLQLLERVVADPELPLSAYELVTVAEKALLLEGWNRTAQPYPGEQRVDTLVTAQAQRTPEAVAVSMGRRRLTYAALDARANQLARFLRSRGIGRETFTGICLDRSPEMMVALLAVMKAGGTYVPLDPALPRARLESMAGDAGLSLVLTRRRWRAALPELSAQTVCVDDDAADIATHSTEGVEWVGSSGDLAYVIYTSGSTGRPKGVEITHRALTNFLWSMRTSPGCTERDTLLAVTTLSFDIAGLELYLPLIVGGRVALASQEEASDGRLLLDRMRQWRPTIMQATPTTWRMLIEAGWTGSDTLTVLCGGEALTLELARKLLQRAAAVWNMYGPTETTIWSTLERVEAGTTGISIGRPIANTCVYILDRAGQPAPVGVPGELCIGGHGLARGYRSQPDLTAERFVPNPFPTTLGDRLYRTGDLARYWPDGRLEHLGRLDFQVKIRGFRVEVGEVEAVLRRHPSIAEVVVAAKDDRTGGKQLVAYVVARPDQPLALSDVRAFAQANLPAYMVPSHIVRLDTFPLTANNKVDVAALPEPTEERAAAAEPPRPPCGQLEVQLTALWRHVLGQDAVAVHDNFFDLGGHSLKAVQLLSHLEKLYGRRLPLAVLFDAPTVARMAALLAESAWESAWECLVAIQPTGSAAPLFLVPGVGGTTLVFGKLARLLGPDQPVYGLQARGLDGKDKPFTSVVEAATHYLSDVRSLRPSGPYVIAGSCTGGVIAYEMAQQLQRQGEHVTLMVIESWHPSSYRLSPSAVGGLAPVRFLCSKLVRYGATLAGLPPHQWPRFVRTKAAKMVEVLLDTGLEGALADNSYYVDEVVEATLHAVAHYETEPYPGGLLNVIAAERPLPPGIIDTRGAWESLARGVSRTISLPAKDSGGLFVSPHVDELAISIARYAADSLPSA